MAAEAKAQVELLDVQSLFSLEGKVVVITGSSRGLGLHAASAQSGCSKVYITSRKVEACQTACDALNDLPNKRAGARAISVPADSSKVEGVEDLLRQVKETTDHVDILFANAGATWGEKFDTHPDKAFGKVMDLNVKSVFNTIRLWVISAQCGHRCEWLSTSPEQGLMDMYGGEEAMAKMNPDQRLGKPEDIAGAVIYLSSRASGHINGACLTIDGGGRWAKDSKM
ncbi:MAG: hypothetical protein OHK93_007067 [Ramalina farinacea]|uniref:Uncharacterized protein n=1 Tax=Ramalina farinacea TaxID=258253 RepID=A0AA43QJT0_9LECA|nr:hypothetical protein [Ramalina farinacea]